ncbi:uncharacterized protein ACRADG_007619 [Cochliomyia hominivorax]
MESNSTLERRYSFNFAKINPDAESTHLNGSSFSWGTSLSPKHRSNSSLCLNNTHTTNDANKKPILVSPKFKNVSKIDARIVADVQSKGLASRIVKYHERGTRLNRSMSAHNLYSKPGQFPAVTLKKTELPYRATKQELSMIRIPPPEKSSFYGNTVSSLLRSNSVLGLQSKRTEDLSRENRPIIHPPPTEDDMAPTRSVLDVLKEISRKRINSDDLVTDETSKKYCNRANTDFVDTGSNYVPGVASSFTSTASLCNQRYKRQRDCATSHQSAHISVTKTSPEQAKKRICNYNNDITSSLSSSIKCKPFGSVKRSSTSNNFNHTMPTNLESYEMQKSKMQRYLNHHDNDKNSSQIDVGFDNLENNLRTAQDRQYNTGVPPKRTASEPIYNSEIQFSMNNQHPKNKPRLTLFNKKCDDDENAEIKDSNEHVAENTNEFNDYDDCAGIPFVKPKKISLISGLRNSVIERAQKSKLALMLSGLKGELYQNSDIDELDSLKKKSSKTEVYEINNTNTNAITSSLITTTTVTKSYSVAASISITANLFDTKAITSTPSLNVSTNKTSSPLVGLKLSQSSSDNVASINTTKCTDTLSGTNKQSLSGFTIGSSSSSSIMNTKTEIKEIRDSKTPIVTTSSSVTSSNVLNITPPINSKTNSSDDINKLKTNIESTGEDNSLQLPSLGTAFTPITSNTSVSSNSTIISKTTNSFTFGRNGTAPTISSSNAIAGATIENSTSNTNNAFIFTAPSTSITTPSIVTLISSTTPSSTTSSSPTIAITSTFGTIAASSSSTAKTSLHTFNVPKQATILTTSNQSTTISSSGGGTTSLTFTFGSNTTPTSTASFGANSIGGTKTQDTIISSFAVNSDSRCQDSSLVDQKKSTTVQKTDTAVFNFGSPSLSASLTTATPTSIFSNIGNSNSLFRSSSNNNSVLTFGSSTEKKSLAVGPTSIFSSAINNNSTSTFGSSVENKPLTIPTISVFGACNKNSSTPTFGSNTENKSMIIPPTSVFGASSVNSNTSAQFSFGSKSEIKNSAKTNNGNNTSGGFSFGAVASSSAEKSGPFVFDINSNGTTNTPNNTFGCTSSENKNFTFGSSVSNSNNPTNIFGGPASKPSENVAPPGGFSFESAMSSKTETFSFGAGGNSFSGNNVSNTNSSSSGFIFGGTAASKSNEPSSNKPFSFGSAQPSQQQQLGTNNNTNTTVFGSSATPKTVPVATFNFNSGNSTTIQSNVSSTNNIFAPPSSNITTGPGERIIRRATRRLQK